MLESPTLAFAQPRAAHKAVGATDWAPLDAKPEFLRLKLAGPSWILKPKPVGPRGRWDLLSQDIFHISSGQSGNNNKYASLTGIKGALATIALYPDATLVDIPARELLLPMKMRMKIERKKMEEDGIIEKVESSEWASPIVVSVNLAEFVVIIQ